MGRRSKYYKAYDGRYRIAHREGVSWASSKCTPIVMETIQRHHIQQGHSLLEIGCGEGRDARKVLEMGYRLKALDVSPEAIAYCKNAMPEYQDCFFVLDCLEDSLEETFDFIYAIAMVHMLVLDEDRNRFYRFIHSHLKSNGIALVCSMGDGKQEMKSNIDEAFEIREREHASGKMLVPATSCRMVSFKGFLDELSENDLSVLEYGIASSMPDFNGLMYAVVERGQATSGCF